MIEQVKIWFKSPLFADAEGLTAVLLRDVIYGHMLLVTIGAFVLWRYIGIFPAFAIMSVNAAAAGFALFLKRRNHAHAASLFLIISLWNLYLVSVLLFDGMLPSVMAGQLMLILAAGLLLGRNAATLLTAVMLITDTIVFQLLFNSTYTAPFTLSSAMIGHGWMFLNFAGAAGLLILLFREIDRAIARMHQTEAELFSTRRKATAALGSALNLQDTLNWVLVLLEGVVAYDSACVFIIEGSKQRAVAIRGFDESLEILNKTYPIDDLITRQITTSQKPLWLHDVRTDSRFTIWEGTEHIRGWMGIPIIVRRATIGYLTLDSKSVGAYGGETAVLAMKFANQAAVAIENTRLFVETQRQAHQLRTLNDLTREMTGSFNTQDLCEVIAKKLQNEYGDQQISIFIVDADAHSFILAGSASNITQTAVKSKAQHIPLDEGIVGQVASNRELYLDNNIQTENDDKHRGESRIVLPLILGEAVIGVLSIESGMVNAFDEIEVTMLRSLSDQIALALEKTRLLENERRQRAQAQALQRVGSLIASSLSLPETLNIIIEQAAMIMDAPYSHIYLIDTNDYLSWSASNTLLEAFVDKPLGEPFSMWVAENKRSLFVPDIIEDERTSDADFAREHGLHSYLGVPIEVNDDLIGVLAIITVQETDFLDDEYDLLLAIAQQAGLAVINGRLFEQIQRHALELEGEVTIRTADLTIANEEQARLQIELEGYAGRLEHLVRQRTSELTQTNDALREEIVNRRQLQKQIQESLARRARQVQISTQVSQEIASAPALDVLFLTMVELIQRRFGYYYVQVFIPLDNVLFAREAAGEARAQMIKDQHRIPMDASQSLVARAARDKTAVLSVDVTADSSWLPNLELPSTKTELAVPIKLGDKVLGVLDIQHDQVGSLTAEDELLMMGLCGQIAVAINSRQLEEKRQQAERALKAYTVELERSNRELQDFAYIASHDLQEPLRKVQAFSDRLASRYGDELGERGLDYLSRMQKASARMQALVNDLLSFSRVTTKARPFTDVDLMKVAEGVISDLEIRLEQTNGRVVLESLPTIEADRLQMRQLFQNLIANGLKFHRPDTPPIVTVTGELFTDDSDITYCQLTVSDNGIGFDEKYTDRIFGIFQRLHGRSAYEGTGIGLAICRKIAERHKGTIIAHSKEGDGATFIVQLPQTQEEPATYEDEE